jgi:hypothetical protein
MKLVKLRTLAWSGLFLVPVIGALGACSGTGVAVGRVADPSQQDEDAVMFVWKTKPVSRLKGSIATVLPDGSEFKGSWVELVQTRPAPPDYQRPQLWMGWQPYWQELQRTRHSTLPLDEGATGVVKVYTGKVLANLRSSDGKRNMSCQFTLDEPKAGLTGGGTGNCQLHDGSVIQLAQLQDAAGQL